MFLVALGIDYNIFLMTRVREETQTRGTRQGTLVALRADRRRDHLGRPGARGHVPVLGSLPLVFLAELGTAVALGVMLDTMSSAPCWSRRSTSTSAADLVAEQARPATGRGPSERVPERAVADDETEPVRGLRL